MAPVSAARAAQDQDVDASDDLALIEGCIALVASGMATRVSLPTSTPPERLLQAAEALAAPSGIRVDVRHDDRGAPRLIIGPVRR